MRFWMFVLVNSFVWFPLALAGGQSEAIDPAEAAKKVAAHAPCRSVVVPSLVCASLVLTGSWATLGQSQEKGKVKADRTENVTLQYRVAKDAVQPSRFVAVIDKGISFPLKINWDLPKVEDTKKQETQDQAKKAFDALIKKLEDKQINGVEFECEGEWLMRGFHLRVTTVPQITEAGKNRIKDYER